MSELMTAPYPYFGGKARVADDVWSRFGGKEVTNYIEPFCGSCAVLLNRPGWDTGSPFHETINDIDAFITNFWRAIKADPQGVAAVCDYPASELDLIAWNNWLSQTIHKAALVEKCKADPRFCDVEIAGRWVWGLSQWVGVGWLAKAVNAKIPRNSHNGVNRFIASSPHPCSDWFGALSERLRWARIACGDWERCIGPPYEFKQGCNAIFLDPPYSIEGDEYYYDSRAYWAGSVGVFEAAMAWAIENGANPHMRIALCGYDKFEMPPDWEVYQWDAIGGYGNQNKRDTMNGKNKNRFRERIWFSPHCVKPSKIAAAVGSFGIATGSERRFKEGQ